MLIGRGLEARLWAVLNKTRKQTGYALIGELNPGCRWCIDDDGEQVGDVGSPFLRLMQYSLWTLKKLRLAHISVSKKTYLIFTTSLTIMTKIADQKLVALAETRQASGGGDSQMCRTGVKARKTDSDMLKEWIDNAQAQLNNTYYAVSNVAHSFALVRRSLEKKSMQDDRATTQTNSSKFPSTLVVEGSGQPEESRDRK